MEDVDRNRIEMVRRENDQVYQAIIWLRANKDRFSAPIHEPAILSVCCFSSRPIQLEKILKISNVYR